MNRKQKRKIYQITVWAAAVLLIAAILGIIVIKVIEHKEEKKYEELKASAVTETVQDSSNAITATAADTNPDASPGQEAQSEEAAQQPWYMDYARTPDKAIDFTALQAQNPDVYAWITIEGTKIDYPIAHCDAETAFYLDHDIDGNKSSSGMIFTDTYNNNDFSDPMTLIYGHNMKNGSMFAGLHAFRDSKFFQENDTIKLYVGDIELDYKIYDCFIAKNEQILDTNDFNDALIFTKYFEGLSEMRDLSVNFREGMDVSFTDHVITLVTCIGQNDKRLFVQAVLQEP